MAPPVKPKPICGWCISTHIADITCNCTEPCDKHWCAAAPDDPFSWRTL